MSKSYNELTSFVCKFGTYSFEVISFELMNAPPMYQKAMDKILDGLSFVFVYLYDIVIFSKTICENLDHIAKVLDSISR